MKFLSWLHALLISIVVTFALTSLLKSTPVYIVNLSFIITLLLSAITIVRFTQFSKAIATLRHQQINKHTDDISHVYPTDYVYLSDKGNDELSGLCTKINTLTSNYAESQKYHMYTERQFIKSLNQQKSASTKSFIEAKQIVDSINDNLHFLYSDLSILQYNGKFNADIINNAVVISKNASDSTNKLATKLEDKRFLEPKPKYELFQINFIAQTIGSVHAEPTLIDISEGIDELYFSLDVSLHRIMGVQFKALLIGNNADLPTSSYRRIFSFNGTPTDKVLTLIVTVRCNPNAALCTQNDLLLIEEIMNGNKMIQSVGSLKHEEVANLYGILQRTNIKIICHWIENVVAEISFIHITPLIESIDQYESLLDKKGAKVIPIGQAKNTFNNAS